MAEFYIIDLRPDFMRKPYITVWRPDDAGYAYPLTWAGRYSKETVDAHPGYYANRGCLASGRPSTRLDRFPAPCEVVEALATPKPKPGIIDGDAGPVLVNDAKTRAALRRAKYLPIAQAEGRDGAA
ncbi:MAG: hypothetical protein RLZZ501_274 [Pseudomonadota bacterium]|jgi:hypothetical protein